MARISGKNIYVYLCLLAIFFLGVFVRSYGFNQPHPLTFDEGLYARLGYQLHKNPTDYSSQRLYQEYKAKGRILPDYLNKPLFKHPPLYCYLISFTYPILGPNIKSASRVSLLFGCLTIFIVFFLGKALYDNRTGLLAAFFLCLDPVHWICSEKIWLETTLTFFMCLAILFFVLGRRQKNYLILGGLSIGLAMLTKYPGALALLIIPSFVILLERQLLNKKEFWLMVCIPFLLFLPWVVWNYGVYGNFISSAVEIHGRLRPLVNLLLSHKIMILAFVLCLGLLLFVMVSKHSILLKLRQRIAIAPAQKGLLAIISLFIGFGLLMIYPPFREIMGNMLSWKYIPTTGWRIGMFGQEPWYFYLARLLELSPVYLFSFFSLWLLFLGQREDLLLILCSLWILSFSILWGNYQSRYILSAVPFLLLLSARLQIWIYDKVGEYLGPRRGLSVRLVFLALVSYFIFKTLWIDAVLAIPNDIAYF